MKKLLLLPFLACALFSSSSFGQGATFTFTNLGSTSSVDAGLDFAGQIWGAYLNSSIPIKVNTYYAALGSGTALAITIPNGRRDFVSAPLDSVWYPTCLANRITSTELNPGEADMDIIINSSINWYFGTDGNPPIGQYDFVTVMLHEIGHGLGFLSIAKIESGNGSIGYVDSTDISPFVTSFPFPKLEGKYSVFSYYMKNGSGTWLRDTTVFPNPSTSLASVLTSGDLFFDAPISNALNSGMVPVYAPSAWASGTSLEHLNEASFTSGTDNALMTPFVGNAEVHHTPGNITLAVLEDIGWSVNYTVGLGETEHIPGFVAYPNPTSGIVTLTFEGGTSSGYCTLADFTGKTLASFSGDLRQTTLDMENYAPGIYLLKVYENGALRGCEKIVKK